jgi:general secretion pathway protein G
MERKKQKRKAFTLIELLVVIIIISMLAAFTAPKLFQYVGKSKKDLAKPSLAFVEGAIERYALACGEYPNDSDGLDALLSPPAGLEEKWNGPYLKASQLLDPWGNPIIYVAEGEINPGSFDLISLGADGTEGGEGDAEDIFND